MSEESIEGELHALLRLRDPRGMHFEVKVISGAFGPLEVGGDSNVMRYLDGRYGDKLGATVAGILRDRTMCEN